LFGNAAHGDDLESGTIYVLCSKSSLPGVAKHRELIHKIGITGGSVDARIAQAAQDIAAALGKQGMVQGKGKNRIPITTARLTSLVRQVE
jgi:hypothetical protein